MTAKDLLYKMLDYSVSFRSDALQDIDPINVRAEQLEVLFKAFGYPAEPAPATEKKLTPTQECQVRVNRLIDHMTLGNYFGKRQAAEYPELAARMKEMELNKNRTQEENEFYGPGLDKLFNLLFQYRSKLYKAINDYPRHFTTISYPGYDLGLSVKNKLDSIIEKNIVEVDEILCLILDPGKRNIPVDELVRNYGYRDIDPADVDGDYYFKDLV